MRARLSIPCDVVADDESRDHRAHLRDVDVLVSMGVHRAPWPRPRRRLRLVQVPGAGLDRIERTALRPGMHLANAYGHEAGIAEYIMGAMIALTRSFARLDARLRQGQWESQWAIGAPAPPLWPELAGKTLGILGFRSYRPGAGATRARRSTCRCAPCGGRPQRTRRKALHFIGGPERLDDVLREADYLAITLPLSPQTRGLIDARAAAADEAGGVPDQRRRAPRSVDETALYEALADGRIAGAALDVWYRYPAAPGPDAAGDAAVPRAAQCAS